MKSRFVAFAICLLGCGLFVVAGPRDELWKEVEDAEKKGLPKTAIEKLEPIIAGAIKDKNYDEAVKAITKKIAFATPKVDERIARLKAETETAPAEMKPLMQAILANWYWNYFQQNRWRFMQRTQTAQAPSEDFTTWDLPRIFAEIDKQYQIVLASAEQLRKVPITDWDELLEKGTAPDSYRPTLYDFLAFEALEFYSSGEQAAARPEDAFELLAESPILASVETFLAWKPETTDEDSPTLRAVLLYQELLRFHQNDEDQSAFLDANLHRLEFGYNKAFGEERAARYKAELKRFADQHAGHEISTRAIANLANVVHGEGDWVEARKIALTGVERNGESVGGKLCHNLIQQIEASESQITTERVWNAPLPTINVAYRNLNKVYFRVVPFDFEEYARSQRWRAENLDENQRGNLLKQNAIHAWSHDLPKTEDYQTRTLELPAPEELKPGPYFLIASHNEEFTGNDNQISFTEFWVSDLALVIRSHQGEGILEGFVLNAITGEPLEGADVRGWQRSDRGQLDSIPSVKTDKNGLFRFTEQNRNSVLLHASHRGHALTTMHSFYINRYDTKPKPREQTMFFTDRALYRPGQTIHFKGICVSVDQSQNNYSTIKGRSVTVVFADVNGKEIERLSLKTNDFGSFSGSVTAPRDRLMGRMVLRVEGEPGGMASIQVEEYKRPKFQVELDTPKDAPKLGEEVQLTGKATAYTGAAIDGAIVRWRVVREVHYPIWWHWRSWWMPPSSSESREIAHGSSTTNANGTFDLAFTAKPDLSVPKESEPTFHFTVFADVIDTTGETRSAERTIRVGYTALAATLSADYWQTDDKPVEITIKTTALDGEGQPASGTVKIHAIKQPDKVQRPDLEGYRPLRPKRGETAGDDVPVDPANPNSWPLGELAYETRFETDASGTAKISANLEAGLYRALLETKDRFGTKVSAVLPLHVLDPEANLLNLRIPNLVAAEKWSLEPGEEFLAVWGSGYDKARAYVEIEQRGEILQSFWTPAGQTQVAIKQKVEENLRGGFQLRVTMVRENRAYLVSRKVDVPWTNKKLTVKWERFVSKLKPGQSETWTATVSGPDAKKAIVELAAALYDASLDAYLPHTWPSMFGVFWQDYSRVHSQFENQLKYLQHLEGHWNQDYKDATLTYRHFPEAIVQMIYQIYRGGTRSRGVPGNAVTEFAAPESATPAPGSEPQENAKASADKSEDRKQTPGPAGEADLANVAARKNLNETAFFFPHLMTGEDGSVRMEFTMPEALTEWKFLGFAHDRDLRAGLLTDQVITAKDLMVQPNPPRFVREGDVIEFTVKVSNASATRQSGTVRLTFAEAASGDSVDSLLENVNRDKPFEIAAGASQSFSWRIKIPDGIGFLTYKAVGSTGRLSDGEEGYLPVLSRRVLVTESLALPIRGKGTKSFTFDKLRKSGESETLKHKSFTVQMVSNPSWYAVMALPYLMEYPHECTEQTFNRLYANAVARHIANSDPKIRRVFDLWKNTAGDTLDSPLEKNEDLKALLLEETPWVRQAAAESQARRNVGILFDDNRLNQETDRLLQKLADQQYEDGRWPWFPGGPPNDYITLYITTGFGRMRHLGAEVGVASAIKSLHRLDAWVTEMYDDIPSDKRDKNHLSTLIAMYLYGRSFFLTDQPIADEHKTAVNYWLGQAKRYSLELGVRQSQGHLAIALNRFNDPETAQGIMASLKERATVDEELGMYWKDTELSWFWYRAPIETQALMIEAFDEVADDQAAVEECKIWLLKQKQTQDWKTTKATADAVYALLLRGTNVLASDERVEVTVGDQPIEPEKVEVGTGFYEERFRGGEIKPELGEITVKKLDEGVAWGSVHWQYLEDMTKVTSHKGTPLKLTKQLYIKTPSEKGPTLQRVDGPVSVGDELVVRIVLRSDRDMEYLHLKDYRGSGTEPVNVLSRYRYQDGLGYYESTRDTASHFFIDYLPKGTYVFEYSVRVQLKGNYQTGFASIQCMYAPEFNSHSESLPLVVE